MLAIIAVGAAIVLGLWQFDGWQVQREAEARDLTRAEPVALNSVLGSDDPFPGSGVGQPVTLEGTWVPDGTLYVSERDSGDQEGFWVVTPLAITDADDPALLVVRGWTPDPSQAPAPPTGTAEMVAWLQPPEGTSGIADDNPDDDVVPQLRIADAIQHVDQDLYGAYAVVADEVAEGDWAVGANAVNPGTSGLTQVQPEETPEVGRFTALRNFFYGVEWWIFGAFAAFVWWQWVRDRVRGDSVTQDDGSQGQTT